MCPTGKYLGLDITAVAGATGDLRPAFDVLDADRDGRISREDLKSFYAAAGTTAGERFDDDDLAAMIAAADDDRDGFVQYDEFERLLASRATHASAAAAAAGSRSAMEDAFRLMDRDGDGKVGFEDLKAYLGWAGMPAADEEVRAMIRVAGGGDGDEGVGLEALARVLAVDLEGIAL
jgi:calmodulin